jgi:hypothetical protein
MNIKSHKDFASGLMFMFAGIAFTWAAMEYPIGNAANMGAGYFPLALGIILVLLGAVITFKSLVVETVDQGRIGKIAWRPLFFIILANLVFGIMLHGIPSLGITPLGLIPGIYSVALVASLASDEFSLKEVAVLGTVLSLLSYAAFIKLLQLPLQVWPAFLSSV